MKVEASLHNYRRSASKARLSVQLIKGQDVGVALMRLETVSRKDNEVLKKLLLSAVANAENNFGLDKNDLFVDAVKVGEGQTMKRWMPRAYGRAGKILKRTCNITVILEQRNPNAAPKKATKKTTDQTTPEGSSKEIAPADSKTIKPVPLETKEQKRKQNAAWTKKVFRRKSA